MLNNVLAYHRPHNSVLSVFKTESEVNSSDSQQEVLKNLFLIRNLSFSGMYLN